MYKKAILGGTFDHFHLGHQQLIDTAFEKASFVTIGVAKENLFQHKFLADRIEAYAVRESNLKAYLAKKGFSQRATIIPIADMFGTTLEEKNIDAIFATEENQKNVQLINTKRKEINFPKLKIIIVPFVKSTDGASISSERIRKGEIDRTGFVYKSLFVKNRIFTLPDDLRRVLQQPISRVVKNTEEVLSIVEGKMVITVGDIITSSLIKANFFLAVAVIDFKTRRSEIPHTSPHGVCVVNQQGTINSQAALALFNGLDHYFKTERQQTIIVDGEEDLLALPAILLAPLGSIVLYGQFDQGVVINEVTEKLKEKIKEILEQFQ